jgi:hypothetical protein
MEESELPNVIHWYIAKIYYKDWYSIQHYVIKCVIDLGQVSGFLWVLRFPPLIKQTPTI